MSLFNLIDFFVLNWGFIMMEKERGFGDLEIQLESAKGDLNKATRFTLVGKIHVNKTLNRKGLKGFCRVSGQRQN